MTLKTQAELEAHMVSSGVQRSRSSIQCAEDSGRASQNPYASEIYRQFVEPLAILIDDAKGSKGAARFQAHVKLLEPLDSWAVAYLAVRCALTSVLTHSGGANGINVRSLSSHLGKTIHSELYLAQFQELSPDLYYILTEDLSKRRSKDVDYRIRVFKDQAKKAGLLIAEWGIGGKDQIGAWLLEQLTRLGMVVSDIPPPGPGKRKPLAVYLTQEVRETIDSISTFFELTRPQYGPCVEPPMDWVTWDNGGFHTAKMRRSTPYCVKAPSASRARIRDLPMPKVLQAINGLQRTAWQVNSKILDVVQSVAKTSPGGELVSHDAGTKPTAPAFMGMYEKGDEMTPEHEEAFKMWKAEAKAWYTKRRHLSACYGRLYMALRTASEYKDYAAIYFVHFADSRGRLYPMTTGISPQGSDMQKGLLRFAEGKALSTPAAVQWFYINGANKFGFDKAPLAQRATWWCDKEDLILAMGTAPEDNLGWLEADNPVQFLAWCMEFAAFRADPANFVSHLPVGLDGSCSGLQHFSAMLLDEVGGRATNLLDLPDMQDIYGKVAEAATARMRAAPEDENGYRTLWLNYGISRKLTKRATMTTPYGVTKHTSVKALIMDHLNAIPEFSEDSFKKSQYLMDFVWPAIGDVVVKGREAMAWLTKAARVVVKNQTPEDEGVISWVTPSGFPATQAYYTTEEHIVRTKLFGHARILVEVDAEETNIARHASGLAPNFVHSMDAAHLHLTLCALQDKHQGMSFAFIHDDFGVHAADAQLLFTTLREEFVTMYSEHDPLQEFSDSNPGLPVTPKKGNLNLLEVLSSDYFFS